MTPINPIFSVQKSDGLEVTIPMMYQGPKKVDGGWRCGMEVEGKKSYWSIRITRIGSVMISLCTCVVLCCDRIQVGVLDTSRDVRLVIR